MFRKRVEAKKPLDAATSSRPLFSASLFPVNETPVGPLQVRHYKLLISMTRSELVYSSEESRWEV